MPANLLNLPCDKVLGIQPEHIDVEHRRRDENLKIACGRKHFALAPEVVFKDVTRLEGLLQDSI